MTMPALSPSAIWAALDFISGLHLCDSRRDIVIRVWPRATGYGVIIMRSSEPADGLAPFEPLRSVSAIVFSVMLLDMLIYVGSWLTRRCWLLWRKQNNRLAITFVGLIKLSFDDKWIEFVSRSGYLLRWNGTSFNVVGISIFFLIGWFSYLWAVDI